MLVSVIIACGCADCAVAIGCCCAVVVVVAGGGVGAMAAGAVRCGWWGWTSVDATAAAAGK